MGNRHLIMKNQQWTMENRHCTIKKTDFGKKFKKMDIGHCKTDVENGV